MIDLGLKFTAAYLLGSVMGSLLVGQLRGGIDIRKLGSRNAGGTNALRTQGRAFALWVLVIDVGKGIFPVLLLPRLEIPFAGADAQVSTELVTYAVAAGAILGHIYPLWYDFRGGKGGATAAGVLCALLPALALPAMGIWLAVIAIPGYVGLATMSVAVGASVYIGATRLAQEMGLFAFSVFVAVLLVYTHRENIERMLNGTENLRQFARFGG